MDIFVPFHSVFENTLAAILGGGASAFLIWGIKRVMDLMEERRYSLSGDYKSYYDDLVDGDSVVQRDVLKIKQRGLKITGDDHNESSNRGWKLSGAIDRASGHVYGFYKAKSHTDSGLGVFIFEQKSDGVLEGLWAGYDSQNKNIESGKYSLVKNLPVHIRGAKDKDAGRILHLSCQELGEGYLSAEDIQNNIDNCFVAEHDGKVIGFSMVECLKKNAFQGYLKGQSWKAPADIRQADESGKIGYLKSVAVSENFQKMGAGRRLVRKSIEAIEKSGADLIFSIGWKTDTVHIAPILLASDFIQRVSFKEFWNKESVEEDYSCPNCGHPCHCEAFLFTRVI